MTRKYFGTDGIRCKAGDFPLTKEFIQKLAYSAANVLAGEKTGHLKTKKVLIGADTRESAIWIFEALCHGFNKAGFAVDFAGTVSTPCLSILTQKDKYSFGVMISASHNPYHDNGIKFFSNFGEKLSDEIEIKIEEKLNSLTNLNSNNFSNLFVYQNISLQTYEIYKAFLLSTFVKEPGKYFGFAGLKIGLDCANGSLFEAAPKIFTELGAETFVLANSPNGKNINQNCGSTHLENLVDLIKSKADAHDNFHLGFAFDGDGDRVIAVRSDGKVLDGDFLLGILAKFLKKKGELQNNALALTVMSNLGLKLFLKAEKIDFFETKVGDRYIYESLLKKNLMLGGEQSGHIILKKYGNTGDGLLVALHIANIFRNIGRIKFFEITDKIKILPQVLVNLRLDEKKDIFAIPEIQAEYQKIENILGDKGRILVRYSGTEPLLRIMIEGENQDEIKKLADGFAEKVKEKINA